MTVFLVGAGPGDPGLLTVRGADVLGRADVVIYDRLSIASLLDLVPAGAIRVGVGKTPRGPSTPQDEINRLLVEHGRSGATVVRLKGGDPFVFARGGEEAAALVEAGVPFEVVPGVTSAIAVPAYAGVPLTSRGTSTSFTVVTGHEDPWAATETDWDAVARVGGTVVVLMGVATRAEIARRLIAGGLAPTTPVCAVQWGTRPQQHTVRTTLAGLGSAEVASPAVIVIGAVAALDLGWFERRPLFGRRVVVTRAASSAGSLSTLLGDAGAVVIELPTIAVAAPADGGAALRDACGRLGTFAWVVFTSANAVERVGDLVRDARAFGDARVAAVGTATSAAVRTTLGIEADLVPATATAAALVEVFPAAPDRATPMAGREVLMPQSAIAATTLADGLRARGWSVTAVDAYTTLAVDVPEAESLAASQADAICFTSGSTVQAWVEAVGADRTPRVVASIGPVTSAALRAVGLTVTVESTEASVASMVAALVAHWSA